MIWVSLNLERACVSSLVGIYYSVQIYDSSRVSRNLYMLGLCCASEFACGMVAACLPSTGRFVQCIRQRKHIGSLRDSPRGARPSAVGQTRTVREILFSTTPSYQSPNSCSPSHTPNRSKRCSQENLALDSHGRTIGHQAIVSASLSPEAARSKSEISTTRTFDVNFSVN